MCKIFMYKTLLILLTVFFFTSCSNVNIDTYRDFKPELVLEEFFSGKLSAHGVVLNRSEKVIRYFNAEIDAFMLDGKLILDEDFVFNDGEEQNRKWVLTKQGGKEWTGTAGDVTGEGKLKLSGNTLFFKYVLQVPYKGKTIEVKVDDRMYLTNANTIINESRMSKYGFHVGTVLLTIIKQ